MKKVSIYTDGSSRGNPGPGGYGAILQYTAEDGRLYEKEFSQGYKYTTNNRMELLAIIVALEELKFPCEVKVTSDSKYVVDTLNLHRLENWISKGWKNAQKKPVANRDLWERFIEARARHQVTFVWTKGHDEDVLNNRCDKLATDAADLPRSQQLDDEGCVSAQGKGVSHD